MSCLERCPYLRGVLIEGFYRTLCTAISCIHEALTFTVISMLHIWCKLYKCKIEVHSFIFSVGFTGIFPPFKGILYIYTCV